MNAMTFSCVPNIQVLEFAAQCLGANGVHLHGFGLNVYKPRSQVAGKGGYGIYGYGTGYTTDAPHQHWWQILTHKRPSGGG